MFYSTIFAFLFFFFRYSKARPFFALSTLYNLFAVLFLYIFNNIEVTRYSWSKFPFVLSGAIGSGRAHDSPVHCARYLVVESGIFSLL